MQNIKILILFLLSTTFCLAQDHHLTLISQRDGLSNAAVITIAQGESDYLWLATPYGLNRYDGHSVKTFYRTDGLLDNTINDLHFDTSGLLWLDTKKGVQTYNGHNFETITNLDSLKTPQFESKNIVDYSFLENQPFSSRIVDTLSYKNNFYVATFGSGLWTYTNDLWKEIDNKLGLFDISIYDLFVDKDGLFWIASNHGLTLFSESEFQIVPFDTIRNSFGMLEFENDIWVCSRTGIDRISDSKSIHYGLEEGASFMLNINTNHTNKLQSGGIGEKIYEWNGKDFKVRTDFNELLKGQFVYDIETHKNKTYYACGGIVLVDDGQKVTTLLPDSIGGMSYDLLADNENLWIANSEGILRIDGTSIQRYSTDEGMSDSNSRLIEKDPNGTIWVGTFSGGLLRFKDNHFTSYNVNNGLNDELIKSIKWDNHRNGLWLGTNNGLHLISTDSLGNIVQIEMYAEPTGYPFKFCHNKALMLKENGEMLFAANTNDQTNEEHIFSLSGSTKSKKSSSPIVQLESFKVNTKRLENLELNNWENFPLNTTFNYRQNQFNFQFNASHFTAGKYLEYQWYLEGLDEDWQNVSSQNNTNYTNLSPGDYSLHLRAKVPNSDWSEEQKYSFTISPPFWRTWWFILIGLSVVIYTITLLAKRRQKQIHDKQILEIKQIQQKASLELSALRAQFNPHFVFNVLNAIQGIIMFKEEEQAITSITDFAKLMRLVLNHSRKQLIYLHDELEFIKLYIGLEQLRFEDRFDFELDLHENIISRGAKVPPLILQPYVENAIKHGLLGKGTQGKLSIFFELEDESLKCTITDNGVGRKKADTKKDKSHTSKGLQMMQERIEYLNIAYGTEGFSHTISDNIQESETTVGTKVILHIPTNLNTK